MSILPLAVMWIKPIAPVIVLMSMMGAFGFVSNFQAPWLGNAAGMFRLRRMEIWKTRRWFIIFFFNIYQQIWHGNWRIYRKLFPWISWIRGKSGSVTSGYQYDRILKIRDANLRIYRILNFHVLL